MNNFNEIVNIYNNKKNEFKALEIKKIELTELCNSYKNFSNDNSNIEKSYNLKIEDLESKQQKVENDLTNLSNRIINMVNKLKNNEVKNVVLLRTFTNKTWNYIAKTCLYSESRVRQLYKEGISILNS